MTKKGRISTVCIVKCYRIGCESTGKSEGTNIVKAERAFLTRGWTSMTKETTMPNYGWQCPSKRHRS